MVSSLSYPRQTPTYASSPNTQPGETRVPYLVRSCYHRCRPLCSVFFQVISSDNNDSIQPAVNHILPRARPSFFRFCFYSNTFTRSRLKGARSGKSTAIDLGRIPGDTQRKLEVVPKNDITVTLSAAEYECVYYELAYPQTDLFYYRALLKTRNLATSEETKSAPAQALYVYMCARQLPFDPCAESKKLRSVLLRDFFLKLIRFINVDVHYKYHLLFDGAFRWCGCKCNRS